MKKDCVIGNSHLGAVVKAFRDSGQSFEYSFDFFGAPWPAFDAIKVCGNRIDGTTISVASGEPLIDRYDMFVVYGGMNCAQQIALFDREMHQAGYSSAVRRASLTYRLRTCRSRVIADSIRQHTQNKIFIVSNNPLLDLVAISDLSAFHAAESLIREAAMPDVYIGFPPELFDERLIPKLDYYRGSVYINGDRRHDNFAVHDNEHMNETGGRMVLDHLIKEIGKHVPVDGSVAAPDVSAAAENLSSRAC